MHNLFHKFVDFLDEANQVRLYVFRSHIIYAIAADSIETIKGDVVAGRLMYSLATDGSSDEEDMFFSIIITPYCSKSGKEGGGREGGLTNRCKMVHSVSIWG
jgi:hypothetical protein